VDLFFSDKIFAIASFGVVIEHFLRRLVEQIPICNDAIILPAILGKKAALLDPLALYHDGKKQAGLGLPLIEKKLGISRFQYYQFGTEMPGADGQMRASHGRSQDRRLAVIKCAAEAIERDYMVRYFQKAGPNETAQSFHLTEEGFSTGEPRTIQIPPQGLRTSNDWALRATQAEASQGAIMEALERHLLLKSFLRFGWKGFRVVQEIKSEEMTILFLTSRFSASALIAGLVVAQSPLYPDDFVPLFHNRKLGLEATRYI